MIEQRKAEIATARTAGLWYLLMALTGMLGFLVYHPQIFIPNDPQETLNRLIASEGLARIRLLLECGVILAQALTAVWFYRLFRTVNHWAALAVALWGTVNALAILLSAIAMGTAVEMATSTLPWDDKVTAIALLSGLSTHAWGLGSLFFGLWLLPLGYLIVSSRRMPVWLGWVLLLGGFGYVLQTFATYAGLGHPALEFLVVPATVGEFWMIGYLFVYGIRPAVEE